MTTEGTKPPPPEALAEIQDVVARARRGDVAVVPRLRELLTRYPVLWQNQGNLAAQVEGSWIGLAAGDNLRVKESLTLYANKLRAELTRPSAGPVERLLVDRVVATWLQLNYFSGIEAAELDKQASPKLLEFRGKRHAQAQRMHEKAMAALLAVQRLLPAPAVIPPTPVPAPLEAAGGAGQSRTPPAERERLFAVASEPAEDDSEAPAAERIRVGITR